MTRILFVLSLLVPIGVYAQDPNSSRQERQPLTRSEPERAAKAQELLAQTRTALSQSAKLDEVKTLSVNAKVRRISYTASASGSGNASVGIIGGDPDITILGASKTKEETVNGRAECELLLPEKFRWEEEIGPTRRGVAFDGERFWMQSNGQRKVIPPNPHFAAMIQQQLQSQYAYLPLGLLLTAPSGFGMEYSYGDEKPFRQTVADVITIISPGAFKADLYLDQKTHLPLLLRLVVGAPGRAVGVFMPPGTSPAAGRRALEIAQQQADAKPPGQQEREKLILFEDYRAVDGVLFPHKITTQINGKLIEELIFTKFKVNQPIKPEKFSEKQ